MGVWDFPCGDSEAGRGAHFGNHKDHSKNGRQVSRPPGLPAKPLSPLFHKCSAGPARLYSNFHRLTDPQPHKQRSPLLGLPANGRRKESKGTARETSFSSFPLFCLSGNRFAAFPFYAINISLLGTGLYPECPYATDRVQTVEFRGLFHFYEDILIKLRPGSVATSLGRSQQAKISNEFSFLQWKHESG